MSEVIDDKVDKFHEALMKRYSKKTLVAIAIGIILFVSWYVHATYGRGPRRTSRANITGIPRPPGCLRGRAEGR